MHALKPALLLTALIAAATAPHAQAASTAAAAPKFFSSIVWAVMENHGTAAAMKLPAERYLVSHGATFQRYFAITHPSGPNYRAMVSGELWSPYETYQKTEPTVASELNTLGVPTIDWYIGGTPDLKHDPYLDLKSKITIKPKGPFDPDQLPPACQVYLGYDDENNAHNGPMSAVDHNIEAVTTALDHSKWFNRADATGKYPVLMMTWDESFTGDNSILTVFYGRGVKPNFVSPTHVNHYNFCRTLTDNWGLPALGKGKTATAITDIWK